MQNKISFYIITVMKEEGISHYGWEIRTKAAIIKNREPITQEKNTCFKSIVFHAKKFLGINIDRRLVKERTEKI